MFNQCVTSMESKLVQETLELETEFQHATEIDIIDINLVMMKLQTKTTTKRTKIDINPVLVN